MSKTERKIWNALPVVLMIVSVGILLFILIGGTKQTPAKLVKVMDVTDIPPKQLTLELADTPLKRAKGLAGRESLPLNQAMLFVFDKEEIQCMWAKEMKIPVVAVFIDSRGKAVNASRMLPGTTNPHCSSKPVRYVLEANERWVKEHGSDPEFFVVQTNPAL